MTNKNVWRLVLDVCMTAVYALLMFGDETGLLFHELAGLALAALFVLHFILNRKMLKALRLRGGRRGPAGTVLLISDYVLPVAMGVLTVTGALISRAVFSFSVGGGHALSELHELSAWVGLSILGLHLLLHLRFVVGAAKSIASRLRDRGVLKGLVSAAAMLLVAGVLFSRVYTLFDQKLEQPAALSSATVESGSRPARPGDATSSATADADDDDDDDDERQPETTAPDGGTTKKEDENSQTQETGDDAEVPSLSDYLDKLFCTGCGKHCSLLAPGCGHGRQQAQQAETQYVQEYGDNV